MIERLPNQHDVSDELAAMLARVGDDLKVSEVVAAPDRVVPAFLSRSILRP